MTDDELITSVAASLRTLESRADGDDIAGRKVSVDSLPRRRIDGATVRFESDGTRAHIEVIVDRASGEIVSASYFLPPAAATRVI
jgi:hypothetical protein